MHFQLPDDDVTTDYETLDRELQQKIEADGYTLVPTVPHSNECCTSHIPITVSVTLLHPHSNHRPLSFPAYIELTSPSHAGQRNPPDEHRAASCIASLDTIPLWSRQRAMGIISGPRGPSAGSNHRERATGAVRTDSCFSRAVGVCVSSHSQVS